LQSLTNHKITFLISEKELRIGDIKDLLEHLKMILD